MGKGTSGQSDDQDNIKASLVLAPKRPEFGKECHHVCRLDRITYQKDCLYTTLAFHFRRSFYVICFKVFFKHHFSLKFGHPQH